MNVIVVVVEKNVFSKIPKEEDDVIVIKMLNMMKLE